MKKLLYFLFLMLPLYGMAQTLSIEVSSNKTDVLTCETLNYTLKYSCASGVGNCTNVTMTASAPSGIIIPTSQNISLINTGIASYSISPDLRTINFVFNEPFMAGSTGILVFEGQGECGKPDGTVATLTGSIQSGSGTPVTGSVNTTLHSTNKFCPGKANGLGLAVDNSTIYNILLQTAGTNGYGANGIGVTNIGPVTVVDQLPTGAIINSVTTLAYDGLPTPVIPAGACVIDQANFKVTCTFPASTFAVTSRYAPAVKISIDVTYPSANGFVADQDVTNVATVTHTPEGSSTPIVLNTGSTINFLDGTTYSNTTPNSCTTQLSPTDKLVSPISKLKLLKTGDNFKLGTNLAYQLAFYNTGNTTLENVVVEDIIPAEVNVTSISGIAQTGTLGTETVTVWIKTDAVPTYTALSVNGIYSVYTVPAGVRVTAIKIEASSMPAGSYLSNMVVRYDPDPNTTATSVKNCLTGTSTTSGVVIDDTYACHDAPVIQPDTFSTLHISKWFTAEPNAQYQSLYETAQAVGRVLWSTLRLENRGGGQALENPVVMDLLPLGLTYLNEISYGTSSCNFPAADVVEVIPNYNGTGRTLIRLKWNSPWPSGCDKWISFKCQVNLLGTSGSSDLYTNEQKNFGGQYAYLNLKGAKNEAFFTGSSTTTKCYKDNYYIAQELYSATDIYDLDGDTKTTGDTLCYAASYIGITTVAQLESVKWVKGQCDSVYTKHPDYGRTMAGGLANYKLIIKNNGNIPATSIEILDILPYIGDIGVRDLTARLTQWRPNLVTPLSTPTGVTVYYTTVQNPCRPDYATAPGCNAPNWTTVLPTDPTTVQGLKFDFGTKILNPGDEIELTWDMRAPVNPPMTGDTIAWNSFAFKAIRADNLDPFLPAEPNKVGIQLKPLIPANYGNRVWIDVNKNGIQDDGEVGIDGVRVELHRDNGDGVADPKNDPLVNYTSTANGGLYLFPSLPAGNYFAVFFVPNGYSTSPANVVTPNDSLDSDGIPTICNGNRVTVTAITDLVADETDLRWDQGVFVDKAALGNYVWFDQNSNNVQDESTTSGVNGVVVCLYKDVNGNGTAEPDGADGAPVARDTTTTDIYGRPGYYLFENLDPGAYFVKFKLATGQTFTPNTGTLTTDGDPTDSDPNSTGVTPVTDLIAGEVDLTWDAGIIIPTGPYNLGNLVWSDLNNNGKVDVGETGINGVTVILYEDRNNNNKPDPDEYVTTTVTATVGGIAGTYTFTNLPAGNYIVQIPDANYSGALLNYTTSTGNDPVPDPDDNVENDDNGTVVAGCGVISQPITLGANAEPLDAGKTNYSVDFGFYKCAKPNYLLSATQPTCAGDNGSIIIGTGTIGDKVGYSIGTTYTGTYASAVLISSLTGGVVVGNIAGSATDVTYTIRMYNGLEACYTDITFVIKALNCCTKPAAGADQTVCAGTSATLTGTAPTTGTWSAQTGNPAGAILGATTTGVATVSFAITATGTYKFIYNISASCEDTMSIVVNAKPVIADGAATICAGETVDLTSKITSYSTLLSPVWTLATVDGTTVTTPTAVKPTVTTTYVLVAQNAAGCKDTANVVVTVNPKPYAGKDSTLACANAATNTLTTAITLSPSPTGGTYTQIGTTPATATITGNNVTGMTVAGTYQFVYTTAAGCKDTVAVIVSPCTGCVKPDAGSDAAAVCQPTTTAKLSAVTLGGTWAPIGSSANPSAASIDANGNITGLSAAGTYKFVYSVTGGGITCTDTAQVVVNAKPVIADGAATICAGATTDLTAAITSYSTLLSPVWTVATAGGTAVATPTAVKPTVTTTYVLVAQNAAGCKDTANVVVTVAPKPYAGKDSTLACANAATNTLTTAITLSPSPTGGTYTQIGTTPAVATIIGNNVTNMTVAGTYQFVYTTAAGCKDTVAVTVAPCTGCVKPDAGPDAAAVCQPTTTAKLSAVTLGGTWAPIVSPANPSSATIDANGNITGLSAAGTYKFVYSVTGGGITCTDTAQVVVNAKPVIADGAATICAGATTDLTAAITSYSTLLSPVWTVATAGGTAVATPTAVKPTVTTTYVLVAQNAAGCKDTANVVVTVAPKPYAGKDSTLACANAATNTLTTAITLSPSPTGGTYTQIGTTPAVATIIGNNVTNMTVAGTYQFVYTTAAGCKDTVAVTVSPCTGCVKPNAGSDAAAVCQPTTTAKLSAVTLGGTWAPIVSPANPSSATIDANGNITGLSAAGTYKFVYSVTGGGITCTDTAQVVVNAKPVIADGAATICAGETVDLTSKITSYSTLLSPVWTVATADGTTVATPTAVKPTVTTTYVLVAQNAAGCKDTANVVVTVNPKPYAGKDSTLACANAATNTLTTAITLSPSPTGGTYTQIGTTPAVATIIGNNVTNMTVAGTYQFVYTTAAGCKDTVAVTVSPCTGCVKPNAGPDAAAVCQPTTTAKLSAVTLGGTWAPIVSPANPSAASIDANGNVTGLSAAGTYKFVYSVTGGGITCTDTAQVVVNAKPVIADGAATICAGETVDLTSKITSYSTLLSPVWTITTADGTTVATPTAVKPTVTTTYVLVAQNAAGCKDTANVVVTVSPKPYAGKDSTLACANAATNTLTTAITLSPSPAGGTYTQIGTTPATATITGNNVTNMTVAGTYQFVYTTAAGCKDTVAVTVSPCTGCVKPDAGPDITLTCPTSGIAPTTATLTPVTVGGTWAAQTGNPATATVTGNNVTGMTVSGTYKFIYSVTSGGEICTDTVAVMVPTCVQPKGSIGNFVWKDTNNDGIQNETGTGVQDVIVQLLQGTTVLATDTTDSNGEYLFSNLISGTYQVEILTTSLPAECALSTKQNLGGDDTKDSDFDPTTGLSQTVTIDATGTGITKDNLTVDGALYVPCILPNFKVTTPAACSSNNSTWSVAITVTQAGIVKVNKGTISGTGTGPYTITGIPAGISLVITDSLSATCKKDTVIAPPISCGCITAPPVIAIGQNLMVCKGDTFPTLKATVVGYGTVDWYKQSAGGVAVATGTLSYKPAGTVTISDTFYLAARNLAVGTCPDPTQRTMLVVTAQNCIDTVDLHLTKKVDKKIVQIGDVITYTIKVWNESTKNATGVEVTDQLPAGVQYVSSVASRGNYNNTTGVWAIGPIAANGDTVTLSIQAKVIAEGVTFNTAEITTVDQKDKDSTPGNGVEGEDDLDRVCITTPIKLCVGQGVDVTIPSTYTGIVWKDAQGNIVPSSGNTVTFTKAGTYSFTATNGACPTGGCCPVIVEEINCCPAEICIPFTITKRRK